MSDLLISSSPANVDTLPLINANAKIHYPALDGIRGIAILMVVFFHNFHFLKFFEYGWLGADLFFVLSGFLITNKLMQTVGSSNWLRNFYLGRIFRTFPLYYFFIIIILFITPLFNVLQEEVHNYSKNQIWLWLYLENWLFIIKPSHSINLLLHFWSLAVEEQFYLLWPILVMVLKKPKRLFIFIITLFLLFIGLRLLLYITPLNGTTYFSFQCFTRIDGICMGIGVALLCIINPYWLSKTLRKQ